jgi:soluble lytic murein transglycosylase-like protein
VKPADLFLFGIGAYLLAKPTVQTKLATPYDAEIIRISRAHGNDPAMIKAIIRRESNFRPDAHLVTANEDSRVLGQINVKNTQVLANLGIDPDHLYEPSYNIEATNRFVDDIKKRYTRTLDIIAAYNAGRVIKTETNEYKNLSYVTAVYGYMTMYQGFA